ncbi:alanine:cation symporter family protein [Actinomycetota bacterium]
MVIFPGFQVCTIASTSQVAFGLPNWVPAVVMTLMVALVVIGGTHRIVRVAQFLVPVLAVGYLVLALAVITVNASRIPEALSLIFRSAFGMEPMLSGIAGASIAWGVRRAVFASSNGLGEATFAAAAARTSHPSKQGLVQTFSIYIDVLLICMATGLMMVVSGQYNVRDGSDGFLIENLPGMDAGAGWVQKAIDTMAPGWGAGFVAIAVFLFGFTCLLLYYYVASTNLIFLLEGRELKWPINLLKLGTLLIVFFGSLVNAELIWALGDIGLGLITWINVVCLVLMFPLVRKIHQDYERQRKAGVDPTFDPAALGIDDADFWYTDAAHDTGHDPHLRQADWPTPRA